MIRNITLLIVALYLHINIAQPQIANNWYLITRGTKTKVNIICKNFNLYDSTITHLGLAKEATNGEMIIYNINPVKDCNAFTIDSLQSFLSPPDIFCYSLWQLKLSPKSKRGLDKFIQGYIGKYVTFDFDFNLENGSENLYCSEFVWLALSAIGYNINVTHKDLSNDNLKSFLKRDDIYYIPADFFEKLPFVKMIHKRFLNSKIF